MSSFRKRSARNESLSRFVVSVFIASLPEGGKKATAGYNCSSWTLAASGAKSPAFSTAIHGEGGGKAPAAGKSKPVASCDERAESIRMRYGGARHLCEPPNV